ncbi:MAG: hypothetical protein V3W31_08835 [Thermodesulfobacteriota bacterium]
MNLLKAFPGFAILAIMFLAAAGGARAETEPFPDGWPRMFESGGNSVVVHQPQLDEWEAYKLMRARAAVSVTLKGDDSEYFGALYIEADTETDFETRTVLLKNSRITDTVFLNVDEGKAEKCRSAVRDALPVGRTITISLDRMMAGLERTKEQTRPVEVNIEPPPIYYSEAPARLVIFNGEPQFKTIDRAPGLLFAINTNWDVLLEVGSSNYFMLDGESWLVTDDVIKGPWKRAGRLPRSFNKLPNDEDWGAVKKRVPGERAKEVPAVFVSTKPAELIVTDGKPTYSPISGTKLLYLANTESDLFLHTGEGHHYFLTAGRWFRAEALDGPWSAASADLPDDFMRIPSTHEKSRVLSSVPGTPEAEVAVLLASVPRKAAVNREDTTIGVPYEGEPQFVEIEGTSTPVYYAVNTPYSVFLVEGVYYSVHNGVWFVASSSSGPWGVADTVPAVIYTIPPTHPKHNVTYVYVYASTPDTVFVGYTSGYSGSYIAMTGVVMFGLGYWWYDPFFPHYRHYHYHPHYYSYGCGYRYDYYYGGFYRSARHYGPYGGAGGWAGYNPRKGRYYRGGYANGPYGTVFARQAYNPYTDRYGGDHIRTRTPYGSWGKTVVAEGGDWARPGRRSLKDKITGWIKTSEGDEAVRYDKKTGHGAVVGKDKYGDVYVGRGGNVYKRDGDRWKKNTGDGWETVHREPAERKAPAKRGMAKKKAEPVRSRPSVKTTPTPPPVMDTGQMGQADRKQGAVKRRGSVSRPEARTFDNLNRERKARRDGDERSRTFKKGGGFDWKKGRGPWR